MDKTLSELLFNLSLARVRASAAIPLYDILRTKRQKLLAEIRLNEFQYTARKIRELLSYTEDQIKIMESELCAINAVKK